MPRKRHYDRLLPKGFEGLERYDRKRSRTVLRGACGLVTVLWAGNGPRLPGHKAACVRRFLATAGCRIVLHFLPPYSPDDNPIERLWKQMHDHVTRNHRHKNIDSLVGAIRRFLDAAQPFPGTKVSTCRLAA